MNYEQTLEYLYAQLPMYHRIGQQAYKADLVNTLALCRILGNPQNTFPTIHITGTNGKGSVSHMLASILKASGYRTGLYTSPHLKDFRERIRIDGRMIGKREVTGFTQKYRDQFEPLGCSFFELTVGMAFEHFRRQAVDVAVIEVGLGGRLDSTNIIRPLVSVITNVSLDHMQLLGDTIEKIAVEKAGIIKPGIPVVIGETQLSIQEFFRHRAMECGSEIRFADQLYRASFAAAAPPAGTRKVTLSRNGVPFLEGVNSPLTGLYQEKNLQTVLAVCDVLLEKGYNLSPAGLRKGIEMTTRATGLRGRWQVLRRHPLTICDTGHNEAGIREVLAQVGGTPHDTLHFVMGMVNDKYLPPVLALLPKDAIYYFCRPGIPRGLDAGDLQRQAREAGLNGEVYPSVRHALKSAQEAAGKHDLVLVGGSTFVVAEVV